MINGQRAVLYVSGTFQIVLLGKEYFAVRDLPLHWLKCNPKPWQNHHLFCRWLQRSVVHFCTSFFTSVVHIHSDLNQNLKWPVANNFQASSSVLEHFLLVSFPSEQVGHAFRRTISDEALDMMFRHCFSAIDSFLNLPVLLLYCISPVWLGKMTGLKIVANVQRKTVKNLQKAWRTIFQVLQSLAPRKQNVMKWAVAHKPQYGIRSIFYCFRQSENKWHSLLHGIITHIYRNTFVLTDTFSGESSVWAVITPICESRRCQTYSFLNPFEASLFLTTPQNTQTDHNL